MMRIVPWEHLAGLTAYRATSCALSVGMFDGVHLGHRAIIRGITAAARGLLPVVVTFSRPPQNVLDPDPARKILLAPARKLELLGSLGVAVAVVIDFSPEFSKMTATSFLKHSPALSASTGWWKGIISILDATAPRAGKP